MYSKTMSGGATGGAPGPWKSRGNRSNNASYHFAISGMDQAGPEAGRRGGYSGQRSGAGSSVGGAQSLGRHGKPAGALSGGSACGASIMEDRTARKIRQFYEQKVDVRKYELVAAFQVERGIVQTYYVYRQRVPFELTERRRALMGRYYKQGRQEVVLYVNGREFEYYVPVSFQPIKNSPPSSRTSTSNSNCSNSSNNNTNTTATGAPPATAGGSRGEEGAAAGEKRSKKSRFKFLSFRS